MALPPVIFDDDARDQYLQTLANTGLKLTAARRHNIPLRLVRSTYDTDPEFAAAFDDAMELFSESVEEELIRRAVHGVTEDVFSAGAMVGTKQVYSDGLLTSLIKKVNPKYNEKTQAEVTITGGVLLTAAIPQTAEEWLASGTEQAPQLPPGHEQPTKVIDLQPDDVRDALVAAAMDTTDE